jgi:flagellar protein FliS
VNNANAVMHYTDQAGITAAPDELLILLLNAEIKNIRRAVVSIKSKDISKAHNSLIKAQDIIDELIMSLDMSYAISNNLLSLYSFIKNQLSQANIHKDPDLLESLLPTVKELRDTWVQASKISRSEKFSTVSFNI